MKVKDPSLIIKIEELKKKWEIFYKEGIESSTIKDEDPWNTLEFDLPSYVEYFLIRLKEERYELTELFACIRYINIYI